MPSQILEKRALTLCMKQCKSSIFSQGNKYLIKADCQCVWKHLLYMLNSISISASISSLSGQVMKGYRAPQEITEGAQINQGQISKIF